MCPHEINNPLTAIFGALFILRRKYEHQPEQMEAIQLVEISSKRIKDIIEKFDQANDLDEQSKGNQTVFNVPGDKKWE